MLFAGIDIHRKTSYVTVIDKSGAVVAKANLPSNPEVITEFFNELSEPPRIAMESTSAWYWLYDHLTGNGYEVVVTNPKKTKAIASARIKNDKLDSNMLAQLLRADLVAEVCVSDLETRALKELLRHRIRLVRDKVRMKARIRNLLAKNNVQLKVTDISSPKAKSLLENIELPFYHQRQLDTYLVLLENLQGSITPLDKELQAEAKRNGQARLLMTIPGVGPVVSLMMLAEIGDISRFRSHRQLASYAGLVPSLDSSAGKHRSGRITKEGSPWLRWALVESAQVVARMNRSKLNLFFRRRIVKSGYRKAVVATARRILQVAFYMLRDQKPYWEEVPESA